MPDAQNRWLNNVISFVTIIVLGTVTVLIMSKLLPSEEKISRNDLVNEVEKRIIKNQKPSEFVDFNLLSSFNSFIIVTNTESFASQPNNITGRIKKTLYPNGQFSRMYIFIKAAVDGGKPLSVYDDIWLTFNFKGGHIFPNDSLPTPALEISQLLYSAQELPYRPQNSKIKDVLDVLALFDNNPKLGVDLFLSSAREGGMINNLTIYYECATGSTCSIK